MTIQYDVRFILLLLSATVILFYVDAGVSNENDKQHAVFKRADPVYYKTDLLKRDIGSMNLNQKPFVSPDDLMSTDFISGPSYNGGKLSSNQRAVILNQHNYYRRNLAQGREKNKDGSLLPAAKNMNNLTWDCNLEASAQKWADRCVFQHSNVHDYGENLFMMTSSGRLPSSESLLKTAAINWWEELREFGIPLSDISNYVFRSNIGHFTAMAWAKTTNLGCGLSYCSGGRQALIVCQYSPPGNIIGGRIYES